MWYVCDVLYAVLYVRVSCFAVHGCAVSRRYIHVCNHDMFSVVVNVMVYLMSVMHPPCLVQPIGTHDGEVMYLGYAALEMSLVS